MFVKTLLFVGFFAAIAAAQQCGPTFGTCPGSLCCSKYNYCGSKSAYCGTGCLSGFGKCSGSSPAPTTVPTVAPAPAPTVTKAPTTAPAATVPATTVNTVPTALPVSSKPISKNGKCQSNGAQCPAGTCCSVYGYCGTTSAYCGDACQVGWGTCSSSPPPASNPVTTVAPAPPAGTTAGSTTPAGTTTVTTAVPNNVIPSISIVTECSVPGTVAFTFDDGPYLYTADIVAKFNAVGGKITFFMNGMNWDCIYSQAAAVKAAYDAGHQIGSHTWSHADLVTLTSDGITTEMTKLSTAFQKILGADPIYMRPPYGSYNDQVTNTLKGLGYKVLANWDTDPGDSIGATVPQEQAIYNALATGSGAPAHVILQHETSIQTAQTMVPFMINWAQQRNLKMVTLGTCLGDSADKWYRNKAAPETQNPTWVC